MRIQHNIPALNAYRSYTQNVAAMKKNLEKLSSGYRINRAGDDAAGLAISEKMRAQITGLEVAQKNAKDGISLVQTAEGAMTEVHDMLNRMYELAEQSSNGTYDNETDRAQMQKEIQSLSDEINRIADSSNFNGIKLLDGTMSSEKIKVATTYKDALSLSDIKGLMLPEKAGATAADVGVNTILETDATNAGAPGFTVDLNGITHVFEDITSTDNSTAGKYIKLTIGGQDIALSEEDIHDNATKAGGGTWANGDKVTTEQLAEAIAKKLTGTWADSSGNNYNVTADGGKLVFAATDNLDTDPNRHYDVTITGVASTAKSAVADVFATGALTQTAYSGNLDATVTIKYTGTDGQSKEKDVTFKTGGNAPASFSNLKAAIEADADLKDLFTVGGSDTGGMTLTSKVAGATVKAEAVTVKTASTDGIAIAAGAGQTTAGKDAYNSGTEGYTNYGTEHVTMSTAAAADQLASTTLDLTGKLKDGNKIKLGDTEYTIALGADSIFKDAENVVYLSDANATEEEIASKLSEVAKDNKTFTVSHQGTTAKIGIKQKIEVKDSTDMSTMDKFASYIGFTEADAEANQAAAKAAAEKQASAKPLTLQIGETADDFNQLQVDIKDMHTISMGLADIDISTQDGAKAAMAAIKDAINYVSDVRGDLGALQNRLDHTINNLSVMHENIQDAESTIRDVDIAEEMMAYTKNNILVQSSQAMLAQANQLPQGVLQLLQ